MNKQIATLRKVGSEGLHLWSCFALSANRWFPTRHSLQQAGQQGVDTEVERLSSRSKVIKVELSDARAQEASMLCQRDAVLLDIGNVLHQDVPVAKDEVGPTSCLTFSTLSLLEHEVGAENGA